MRLYSSFLLRCWLTDDGLQVRQSVLQVEHIQTGASTRAESLSEVEPWIFDACRNAPAARRTMGPSPIAPASTHSGVQMFATTTPAAPRRSRRSRNGR